MITVEKFGQVCVCQDCKDEHTMTIAKYGKELLDNAKLAQENAILRQQIVDMKRCRNCKFEDGFHNRVSEQSGHCIGCGDYENWQMKGADSGEF
jgi:hypothetical protein